jgi:hypothetical protein
VATETSTLMRETRLRHASPDAFAGMGHSADTEPGGDACRLLGATQGTGRIVRPDDPSQFGLRLGGVGGAGVGVLAGVDERLGDLAELEVEVLGGSA